MTRKQKTFFSTLSGKTLWIAILVVLLAIGGYIYYAKGYVTNRTVTPSSTIQTARAQQGNLIVSASGKGTLIANSEATFGFKTSGQVTDVKVKVGDTVEAGQVLAQLDDTLARMKYTEAQQALQELYSAASIANVEKEIGTAQDTEYYAHEWLKYLLSPEVVEAEENLAIAQQKLTDAQATVKASPSSTADQAVKEAQSAVDFLSDKLTQAQTYYQNEYLPKTFGEYENVGSRRHPKQVLATYIDPKTGLEFPKITAPSADDIATARNNLAQAQQTIKDDQAYLDILKAGSIPEGATGAKLTTLYEAQQAVDSAKAALDENELIAPISGTVTSLSLSAGQQVDTSSIITISELNQPYVLDAYVDAADWSTAKVGNNVTVTFDLLPEKTFHGTVTLVYPEVDTSFEASLIQIHVQLDQSITQDLPAGTGVTIQVLGDEARNVVMVPIGAIHQTNGTHYVNVLQNGQKVKRAVEVGLKNATYAEIKSGLETGEIVVTK